MTVALPEPRPVPTARASRSYDDETQARPLDEFLGTTARRGGQIPIPLASDLAVPYDSLPSLEMSVPDAAYAAEDDDAETAPPAPESATAAPIPRHKVVRESGKQLRNSFADSDEQPATQAFPDNVNESGPQRKPPAPATVREESHPSLGTSIPDGFVVGVQPLRTAAVAAPAAYAPRPQLMSSPSARHPGPMYTSALPPQQPLQAAMAPMAAMQPAPMYQMHIRPSGPSLSVSQPGQTTMSENGEARSKIARFAWFVFGAAFGIVFAFVAVGFAPQLGKKDTPAQAPVATAAAATPAEQPPAAPPPAVLPAAPPVVAAQAAPVIIAPPPVVTAPIAPPVVMTPPSFTPAAAPAAPTARAQRPAAVTRRAPSNDDTYEPKPARPAPAAKEKSDSPGDLLSAGLGP